MWSQHHLLAHVYTYDSYSRVQGLVCVCVFVWAHESRDVAALHGATPPHDSNCSGGGDPVAVTEGSGALLQQRSQLSPVPWGGRYTLPLPGPIASKSSCWPRLCPLPPVPTSCSLWEAKRGASWSSWWGGRAAQQWVACPPGVISSRRPRLLEAPDFGGPGCWRHADQS